MAKRQSLRNHNIFPNQTMVVCSTQCCNLSNSKRNSNNRGTQMFSCRSLWSMSKYHSRLSMKSISLVQLIIAIILILPTLNECFSYRIQATLVKTAVAIRIAQAPKTSTLLSSIMKLVRKSPSRSSSNQPWNQGEQHPFSCWIYGRKRNLNTRYQWQLSQSCKECWNS